MSVTDPLLKELKGHTIKLVRFNEGKTDGDQVEINDDNEDLREFCICVEKILYKGIKPRRLYRIPFKTEYEPWHWLENLADQTRLDNIFDSKPHLLNYRKIVPYSYTSSGVAVKQCSKVTTSNGKMRLLIRYCLVNKCLHVPVETLMKCGEACFNYSSNSILADEILTEIFLSVLMQVSRLTFKLDLKNTTFLDLTWYLPVTEKYQFVPCNTLGLIITFVCNVAVINEIVPGSIAAEEESIEVGDILSEINGFEITLKTKGSLKETLKKGFMEPVTVTIVKSYNPKTGKTFPAMLDILPLTSIDTPKLLAQRKEKYDMINIPDDVAYVGEVDTKVPGIIATPKMSGKESAKSNRPGVPVTFVGKVPTGKDGDVKTIGIAMDVLLKQDLKNAIKQETLLECQEIGIKLSDMKSSKVLLKNSYMEISACGHTKNYPNYFAYIAGDNNVSCNCAESYSCYIFHCPKNEDIEEILCSIGQGFRRTHYAV